MDKHLNKYVSENILRVFGNCVVILYAVLIIDYLIGTANYYYVLPSISISNFVWPVLLIVSLTKIFNGSYRESIFLLLSSDDDCDCQ